MITNSSLHDFYDRNGIELPDNVIREVGHFNVFESEKLFHPDGTRTMPYSRRMYYKISWLQGNSKAEYADKTVDIQGSALLFATPKIPYNWVPQNQDQQGMFCIFTPEFMTAGKTGIVLEDLPLFQPGQLPVFHLAAGEVAEVAYIFRKMLKEAGGDYQFKYDLLRAMVLELIHYGQKLQPLTSLSVAHNASDRIFSLFNELLERQFPIQNTAQTLDLRAPKDYADRLAVHVNHLNKVIKELSGSTTTQLLGQRILQEAKILLMQTNWSIADIAHSLGFDDLAHFSRFFKKQTTLSPLVFRS